MSKLAKIICRSGEELEYDGSIPEHLDIKGGEITYTETDVEAAYEAGKIDNENRNFLLNLLAEYEINPTVLEAVQLYRSRLKRGLKPGQELFIRMQELGLRHHLELKASRGINISGYELPSVDLSGAIIAGDIDMSHSIVRKTVSLDASSIGGRVGMEKAVIGDYVWLESSEIRGPVCMTRVKIEGHVNLNDAFIEGDVMMDGAEIGSGVDQGKAEIGGVVCLAEAKIKGDVYQKDAKIRKGVNLDDAEIEGEMIQEGAEIGKFED